MPWVRFDDQFTIHRKVSGLSDPAFRLHSEAIFWCARNLTDGFVPAADLLLLATARRPLKFVPELVARGNWHEAASVCDSKKCPAHSDNRANAPADGWVIHDYFEYQPTKSRVQADRANNAERQKRFREKQAGTGQPESRSESNAVSNAVTNGCSKSTPSRPGPARTDGGTGELADVRNQSVNARARVNEALRWLSARYGLTDAEASTVWETAARRAKDPIRNPIKYLERMVERGHLVDIVEAVQPAPVPRPDAEPEPAPDPEPELEPPPLRALDGAASSGPGPTQPPMLSIVDTTPAAEPPRDLGLPDDIVLAALAQLTMSGFPYQAAAARWFASHDPDASEAQVNAYALQLAWGSPKDRAELARDPGVAAALTERTA